MDRRYDDSPAATGFAIDYPIPHVFPSPLYVIGSYPLEGTSKLISYVYPGTPDIEPYRANQ